MDDLIDLLLIFPVTCGIVKPLAFLPTAIKEQGNQHQGPGRDEEHDEESFTLHGESVPQPENF
jgi:hypothetical protein